MTNAKVFIFYKSTFRPWAMRPDPLCGGVFSHLGHIQQVDLKEEAQGAAGDLVGRPADGIAQLTAHWQAAPLVPLLGKKRRVEKMSCEDKRLCVSAEKCSGTELWSTYHLAWKQLVPVNCLKMKNFMFQREVWLKQQCTVWSSLVTALQYISALLSASLTWDGRRDDTS